MSTLRMLDKDYWATEDGHWSIERNESVFDEGVDWYTVKNLIVDPGFGTIEEEFDVYPQAREYVVAQYKKEVTG